MKEPKTSATSTQARHRDNVDLLVKIVKWPAIGALFAGGALLATRFIGPPLARDLAKNLGAHAGESFAEGWAKAREKIAQIKRQQSISGWGTYR